MKNSKASKTTEKTSVLHTLLHRIIYPGSLIYTVLCTVFYIAGAAFDYNTQQMVLSRKSGFLLLAFSFILASANNLFKSKNLHISLKIFLHYVITSLSFYVLFISVSGYDPGRSSTMILLLVYTVIYFSVCATVLIIRGHNKNKKIASSDYKSIYN